MDQKKVGGFLKELRKEKGITQEKFAEQLGISARTVSRWETGNNMPDISLLVEIADYYDVDVRELIEGEKKSEMMSEDIREVATNMAVYAETEKSTLLKNIRFIGILGIIALSATTIIQCIHYDFYNSPSGTLFGILASFGALIAMAALVLYVNGLLQKIVKKKAFSIAVKVFVFTVLAACSKFMFSFVLLFAIAILEILSPATTREGLENYNKSEILEEYNSDLNSKLMTFPDNTEAIVEGEYKSVFRIGLLDTDGYMVLKAKYNKEDYYAEVKRISSLKKDGERLFDDIIYDEENYNYPAYVASDGFDTVFEYVLLDEKDSTIIYVYFSYPNKTQLNAYKDYAKKDLDGYKHDGYSGDLFNIYYDRE